MLKRTILVGFFGLCYSTSSFSAKKIWILEGLLIKTKSSFVLVLNPGTPVMKSIAIDKISTTAKYFREYDSGTLVKACFSGTLQPSMLTRIEPLAPSSNAKFIENVQNELVATCPF